MRASRPGTTSRSGTRSSRSPVGQADDRYLHLRAGACGHREGYRTLRVGHAIPCHSAYAQAVDAGLSPETITVCSYPGKTAGTNFGAAPSTPKLYPLGSKSTFLTTLTAKVPVAATPVLGALGSLHAAASSSNSTEHQWRTNSARGGSARSWRLEARTLACCTSSETLAMGTSLVALRTLCRRFVEPPLLQCHEHLDNPCALPQRL